MPTGFSKMAPIVVRHHDQAVPGATEAMAHAGRQVGQTGAVVAIGNFDGVHRGHQQVIARAAAVAKAQDLPFGALTFEPHPRQFFAPDGPPFRLTSDAGRIRWLTALGVDVIYALPFDAAMAARSADAFFDDVLCAGLGARHLVVGYDFVFGRKRSGDVDFLRRRASAADVGLTIVDPVADTSGTVWSSTRIRAALRAGHPAEAAAILGRLWEIEGTVITGDQRGRLLGFPTANIALSDYVQPAFGVYAVKVGIIDNDHGRTDWVDGVANLGKRPTVGDDKILLEVHLFDLDRDLYGQTLRVAFADYLRPEQKFDGLDALKARIALDGQHAREVLAGVVPPGVPTGEPALTGRSGITVE